MTTHCHNILFFFLDIEKKATTICFFYSNNTIEKDNDALSLSYSFQTQKKTKHTRKQQKKTKRREGAYLQALALPFHFWLSLLPFYSKCFLLASSSYQVEEKEKNKEKKTIEKKTNA
jgi:hypothetical protein